jgi:hypothetical protein
MSNLIPEKNTLKTSENGILESDCNWEIIKSILKKKKNNSQNKTRRNKNFIEENIVFFIRE